LLTGRWRGDARRAGSPRGALASGLCCGVLVALFVTAARWVNGGRLAGPLLFDDAYIYLAAAKTFLATGRLAVSPHHATLGGLTSPSYALLLASGALFVDPVPFARALAFGAGAASLVVSFMLVRRAYGRRAGSRLVAFAATLLLASSGTMATHVLTGMETSLVVALLLVTALLYVRRGPGLACGGVAAALAALRPDGAIVAVGVCLEELIDVARTPAAARGDRWRALARFVCPVAVFAAAQALVFLAYLGRPTADSIGARMLLYCWGSDPVGSRVAAVLHGVAAACLNAPLVGVLVVAGAVDGFAHANDDSRVAALARWLTIVSLGYLAVFAWFGVPLDYQVARYTVPLQATLLALAMVALARLASRLSTARKPVTAAVSAGLALLFAVDARNELRRYGELRADARLFTQVNTAYQQTLARLAASTGPGDRLAVSDVGQAAFVLPRPVIDLAGLANPEMLAFFRDGGRRCIPPAERDLSGVPAHFGVRYVVVDADYWTPFLPSLQRDLTPAPGGVPPSRVYRVPAAPVSPAS
jgi:hypothetical protein